MGSGVSGACPGRRSWPSQSATWGSSPRKITPWRAPISRRLADLVESHLDLDGLLAALAPAPLEPIPAPPASPASVVRLGVARDQAFCFYYPDNLEWLENFGAEIVPFSPLADADLPPDLHGLYLGGGYPELGAPQLSANQAMRRIIRERAAAGLPIYAECGGLMYLGQEISDLEGKRHPMAGVLPMSVRMLPRLKSLGYREVTLTGDGLLGPAGTRLRGHEFHYSEIVDRACWPAPALPAHGQPRRRARAAKAIAPNQVLASYVHLHFGSNPEAARHFVACCIKYKDN